MGRISELAKHEMILSGTLTPVEGFSIVSGAVRPILSEQVRTRVSESHGRLQTALAERRHIYGLTTGFGPLANRLVDPDDGVILQQNLVHHLASGVGPHYAWMHSRAIVLARLNAIVQGVSGASLQTVEKLVALLASSLAPAIPSRGTVGASGDLTPLAHMVLCMQGRAGFLTREGANVPGSEALAIMGLTPLDLSERDGLALVNGTSAMTGVALCNTVYATRLLNWAVALSAALAECLGARQEAWDPVFARIRPHAGQISVTQTLNALLTGATRLETTPIAQRKLDRDAIRTEDRIGQDAYTLRCVPQVLGAARDVLDWHTSIVTTEINAATDNPVFPEDGVEPALHGGNFMGQHIGLASDSLAQALCVMAGLAERQVARLTDERLNNGLPAFLHRGRAGLNSGLMGAQVTATALVAEMRAQGAASSQSISTNGANQDVVSMGTIAARGTARQIARCSEVLAILGLSVAQAMDILRIQDDARFSDAANKMRSWVRERSPELEEDRPLGLDISRIAQAILDDDKLHKATFTSIEY